MIDDAGDNTNPWVVRNTVVENNLESEDKTGVDLVSSGAACKKPAAHKKNANASKAVRFMNLHF